MAIVLCRDIANGLLKEPCPPLERLAAAPGRTPEADRNGWPSLGQGLSSAVWLRSTHEIKRRGTGALVWLHGEEGMGNMPQDLAQCSRAQGKDTESGAAELASHVLWINHGGWGCNAWRSLRAHQPQDALVALHCLPWGVGIGGACGRFSAMRYSGIVVKLKSFDTRAEFVSFPSHARCVTSDKLLNFSEA